MIYGSACRRKKKKLSIFLRGVATKRSFTRAPFETRNPTPFALTTSERSQKECYMYTFNLPPLPKKGLWKFSKWIRLVQRREGAMVGNLLWVGGNLGSVCVCVCVCAHACLNLKVK